MSSFRIGPRHASTLGSTPSFATWIALVQAARPHNGLAIALLALIGCLHGEGLPAPMAVAGLVLAIVLLGAASQYVNDVVDLPADRLNRPCRPLPGGRATLGQMRRAAAICLVSGPIIGIVCRPDWWGWWLAWTALGPGYSLVAKGRGWLAPVWTAGTIASFYLPGAVAGGVATGKVIVFMAVLYFLFLREMVKGLEDEGGDVAVGYRPPGEGWLGRPATLMILGAPLLLATVHAALDAPAGWPVRLACLAFAAILMIAILGMRSERWRRRHLAGAWLKAGAFCGLAAVVTWKP